MADGTSKPIKDIRIGDKVAKGGEVEGVMQFTGGDGLCRLGPNLVITQDHNVYHQGEVCTVRDR